MRFLFAFVALCSPLIAEDKTKESGFAPLEAKGWQKGVFVNKEGYLDGGGRYVKKQFTNFVLRFDFRLKPGANSGIGIRTPIKGNPAYAGMEIQVLEDSHPRYKGLKKWQYHGSIYGVVAAKRGALKKPGEWNTEEIIANGTQIKVTVNGTVIIDADLAKAAPQGKTLDNKKHGGLFNKTGYIALCGHGGGVDFRNMRIKELPASKEK